MNKAFVNLLVRWLVLALGLVLATKLDIGIECKDTPTLAVVVLLLGFFNAVLKPLLLLFTLPFIILTLGIGIWVINALLLCLVAWLVKDFHVAGFGAAMLGSLIVSVTNLVMNRFLPDKKPAAPPARPATKRDDVIDI